MKKSHILFSFVFYCQVSFSQAPTAKQWDARFGGTGMDEPTTFQQTADGGYIVGGFSVSGIGGDKTQANQGAWDYWIVKISASGVKQWDKDFGGTGDDRLFALKQTKDGGYILGGYSASGISGDKTQLSRGGSDYWIIKMDSLGNKQWDKDFGGANDDVLTSLQQTKDRGYILGGRSSSGISGDKTQANWDPTNASYDYWIVKTDSLGIKQWDKRFGGTASDALSAIQQTTDGGYVLGGQSTSGIGGDKTQPIWGTNNYSDYWVVKIDSLGNKQWDKDFGGTNGEAFSSLQQTTDGGYILGGVSISGISGNKTQADWDTTLFTPDYWIVKIDSLGNQQWDKDFGGTMSEDFFGNISQTSDGGYLFAGTSYSNQSGNKSENNSFGAEQNWVVKTDSLGIKQWDKTIFTPGESEAGFAIQTKEGCYAMAAMDNGAVGGYKTQPSQGAWDYWIIKFCDSTTAALPISNFISSDTAFCGEPGKCISFADHSTGNPTSWQWLFPGVIPNFSNQQNPTNICYNQPGTYPVTLIVANASGSDTLTVSPMITVGSTPPAPTITIVGDTLYSSHAASYQWYLNGSAIAGATDSFYVATQNGTYSVGITDSYGCSILSGGIAVGIDELQVSNFGVQVYPNPVSDFLTLSSISPLKEDAKIIITDVTGGELGNRTVKRSTSTYSFPMDDFSDGVYFIQIQYEKRIIYLKFVVAHG